MASWRWRGVILRGRPRRPAKGRPPERQIKVLVLDTRGSVIWFTDHLEKLHPPPRDPLAWNPVRCAKGGRPPEIAYEHRDDVVAPARHLGGKRAADVYRRRQRYNADVMGISSDVDGHRQTAVDQRLAEGVSAY
jgi:hypothetical protein